MSDYVQIVILCEDRQQEVFARQFLIICYLQGEAVNETDVYPGLSREGDCRPLVQRLASKPIYRLTYDVPPSLRAACVELQRIFPAKQCTLEGEA